GVPRGDEITHDVVGVVDAARLRRFDRALRETPIRLCECLARSIGVGLRGAYFVGTAPGQIRRGDRSLELGDGSFVALELGADVVERGTADKTRLVESLLALEVGLGQLARCFCLPELFLDRLHFGRTLSRLEVLESRLGAAQLLLGLLADRDLVLL